MGCSQPGPATTVNVPSYAPPSPPGMPTVSVNDIDQNRVEVFVAWPPVAGAMYYRVYVNNDVVVDRVQGTNYTLILTPGSTYDIAVAACDSNMVCSDKGPSRRINIPPYLPVPQTPGAPMVNTIQVTGPNSAVVYLRWEPVPSAEYYDIYVNGSYHKSTTITNGASVDVTPGTTVSVAIKACNYRGCSSLGPSVNVTVPSYQQEQQCPTSWFYQIRGLVENNIIQEALRDIQSMLPQRQDIPSGCTVYVAEFTTSDGYYNVFAITGDLNSAISMLSSNGFRFVRTITTFTRP